MTIIFPALAVSVAAFCVWLTVRYVNRRERSAKRAVLLLIAIAVLYPLSFGPASAALEREWISLEIFDRAYGPLIGVLHRCPREVRVRAIQWGTFCGGSDILLFFMMHAPQDL